MSLFQLTWNSVCVYWFSSVKVVKCSLSVNKDHIHCARKSQTSFSRKNVLIYHWEVEVSRSLSLTIWLSWNTNIWDEWVLWKKRQPGKDVRSSLLMSSAAVTVALQLLQREQKGRVQAHIRPREVNPCPVEMWCVFSTEPSSVSDPVPALGDRCFSKTGTRKELSKRAKKM